MESSKVTDQRQCKSMQFFVAIVTYTKQGCPSKPPHTKTHEAGMPMGFVRNQQTAHDQSSRPVQAMRGSAARTQRTVEWTRRARMVACDVLDLHRVAWIDDYSAGKSVSIHFARVLDSLDVLERALIFLLLRLSLLDLFF